MSKTVWLELTPTEANALMVMLDNEMDSWLQYGEGVDITNWETLDLDAYKILAYLKFKTWYERNCNEQISD